MKVLQTSPFPLGYRASEAQYNESAVLFQHAMAGLAPPIPSASGDVPDHRTASPRAPFALECLEPSRNEGRLLTRMLISPVVWLAAGALWSVVVALMLRSASPH